MPDKFAISEALNIGPISSGSDRTVDITTTGAKSGKPQRIEIWFHQIEGRWYITGTPPTPRAWYRNLEADPHFTFHLKNQLQADLSAEARLVTEEDERRAVLKRILDNIKDPSNPAPLPTQPPALEEWVTHSPLVEILLDDLR